MQKIGYDYSSVMKMFGGGVKKINKTVNDVKAERVMEGWAKGKVAVIGGSNMDRVEDFAKGINAEFWTGYDPNISFEKNRANNRKWIQKLKDEGYTIYDIGIDTKKNPEKIKGEYYKMEIEEVFGDKN